jgi:hypothetical protein
VGEPLYWRRDVGIWDEVREGGLEMGLCICASLRGTSREEVY